MKRGFLYYCLIFSLLAHLLAVAFVRFDNEGKKKEKDPVVVDLLGPLRHGLKTVLPETAKEPAERPAPPLAPRPASVAGALPSLPSLPPLPIPEARQAVPEVPHEPGPAETVQEPAPGRPAPSPEMRSPDSPSAPENPSPASRPRLVKPTQEDLMRYAKVDREVERTKDQEVVTLDTDDLMYTSYLQAMRKRIELIWKYPETARREGLQGNLVMRFSIGKSGRVEDVQLLKSSGYPMLDEAAKQALLDASPFNPLPDNWGKESFTITGTFMYRLYGLYLR